ncbi:hypothetical protein PG994_000965 [Apiospora phragmitis]|uniref:Tetratricopeptide repeat protein n=1 Tax=Apiospora phragmitis TaxID=2905665 RepID=A0ABR1WR29_9PEZI
MGDLDEAVECAREALEITPKGEILDQGLYSNLLCGSPRERHSRVGAMADLDEAIQAGRRAADLIPTTHVDRPKIFHNLAMTLHQRYARTDSAGDLDEAIQFITTAIPPYPFSWAKDAAVEGLTNLEEAIVVARQAIETTPPSHPTRGTFNYSLGRRLVRKLWAVDGDTDCLREAIACLTYVLEDPRTLTLRRILAGKSILEESLNWHEAHEASSLAVQLIPTLTSKSLGNADRQQLLGQLAGLASDAAATALFEEKGPLAAVKLLEQGRGVLAASQNGLSISEIYWHSPSSHLTAPSVGKELETLLREIRELPGFENFLGQPGESEMRDAASHGLIVVINVSEF